MSGVNPSSSTMSLDLRLSQIEEDLKKWMFDQLTLDAVEDITRAIAQIDSAKTQQLPQVNVATADDSSGPRRTLTDACDNAAVLKPAVNGCAKIAPAVIPLDFKLRQWRPLNAVAIPSSSTAAAAQATAAKSRTTPLHRDMKQQLTPTTALTAPRSSSPTRSFSVTPGDLNCQGNISTPTTTMDAVDGHQLPPFSAKIPTEEQKRVKSASKDRFIGNDNSASDVSNPIAESCSPAVCNVTADVNLTTEAANKNVPQAESTKLGHNAVRSDSRPIARIAPAVVTPTSSTAVERERSARSIVNCYGPHPAEAEIKKTTATSIDAAANTSTLTLMPGDDCAKIKLRLSGDDLQLNGKSKKAAAIIEEIHQIADNGCGLPQVCKVPTKVTAWNTHSRQPRSAKPTITVVENIGKSTNDMKIKKGEISAASRFKYRSVSNDITPLDRPENADNTTTAGVNADELHPAMILSNSNATETSFDTSSNGYRQFSAYGRRRNSSFGAGCQKKLKVCKHLSMFPAPNTCGTKSSTSEDASSGSIVTNGDWNHGDQLYETIAVSTLKSANRLPKTRSLFIVSRNDANDDEEVFSSKPEVVNTADIGFPFSLPLSPVSFLLSSGEDENGNALFPDQGASSTSQLAGKNISVEKQRSKESSDRLINDAGQLAVGIADDYERVEHFYRSRASRVFVARTSASLYISATRFANASASGMMTTGQLPPFLASVTSHRDCGSNAATSSDSSRRTKSHDIGADGSSSWSYVQSGVPVLVLNTGDGLRRRQLTIILADRRTGFVLWSQTVDHLTDYQALNENQMWSQQSTSATERRRHSSAEVEQTTKKGRLDGGKNRHGRRWHTMRLSTDHSRLAGLCFDELTAADEFLRIIVSLTSNPEDPLLNVSRQNRSTGRRLRRLGTDRRRSSLSSFVERSSISAPCCFAHVTRMSRDEATRIMDSGSGVIGAVVLSTR